MTPISRVQGNQPVQGTPNLQYSAGAKAKNVTIFSELPKASNPQEQPKEPTKWLRPGSFDLNEFSQSTETVNGEKRLVYTDKEGNKYVSMSGADLVLLDKVKSGNLFHKAKYKTSLSREEYDSLLKENVNFNAIAVTEMASDENEGNLKATNIDLKESFKDYEFMRHGSDKNIGVVTVNGERLLVSLEDNGEVQLYRQKDGSKSPECEDFKSMDDLMSALKDKNRDWGKYKGVGNPEQYYMPRKGVK